MSKARSTNHNSTQKFTEIIDIVDDIVLLEGGNACMVIEITASNFSLLSEREQDAKIYAYASLLNSLNFPIQILIRNKRMDITSYLKELEAEELKSKNELLTNHIAMYRDFVREMITINVVLNKAFYVVIHFSSLEDGLSGVKTKINKNEAEKQAFVNSAQKSLYSKAESVHQQLAKLALVSKTLQKEELIQLFYDVFNDASMQSSMANLDINTPLIKPA